MLRSALILFTLVALSCSPVKKYQSLPEVTAWEDEIQKFEQLDKTDIYQEESILFSGSSSIRLWSTLEQDMAPYPVIQRGYGGAKLSDFVVYASRIIDPHPCKAIVIFIANDITGSERDKSPEEVARLFRILLKTIRKTHPETPVFWIAITPTASRWKVWPSIKEANNKVKAICKSKPNCYFISTESAFLNDKGDPISEYFREDKLHLTEKGYSVWTGIVKNELNKVIMPAKVEIIAHRGASFLAPENTVAAANLAWEMGADAVETDIYLTKDNKVVVCHDGNTKRTTGEDYVIKETDSGVLRTLDAGSFKSEKYKGEKIPFLEEIIQTIPPNKELVIELKCGSEVLPYLKEILSRNAENKKFVFIAFDFQTITDTKEVFPDNPCYWLCGNKELLSTKINQLSSSGLNGISLNYSIITKEVAAQARLMKMELFSWTVDNPDEARRLISLGVKGITTNRPGWLREQVY